MNNDIIEGNWKQVMGDIKKQWGKLTDDHLAKIEGSHEKLVGAIQENYGILKDEAEKQIQDWHVFRKNMTDKMTQKD
jgi:uncharacterized protein YjbJ (UPF0337 family)